VFAGCSDSLKCSRTATFDVNVSVYFTERFNSCEDFDLIQPVSIGVLEGFIRFIFLNTA
jgi:hypothetical protein